MTSSIYDLKIANPSVAPRFPSRLHISKPILLQPNEFNVSFRQGCGGLKFFWRGELCQVGRCRSTQRSGRCWLKGSELEESWTGGFLVLGRVDCFAPLAGSGE
jgi:hypothetical protein